MNSKRTHHEYGETSLGREPSDAYPDRSPWDPSPMDWYSGAGFEYKQRVEAFINKIIETSGPDYLPQVVRQAVLINFLGTQARLMQHNFEAYQDLLQRYDVTDERTANVLERARGGSATQSELVELIRDTPLVSLELAKLTHPYGVRNEYLEPMEELVLAAIDENGGVIYSDDERSAPRIKINHHQKHTDHFIVTSRHVIGEVGDALVAKRTAAVVLVDETLGFDADIASRMKKVVSGEPDEQWHNRVFKKSGVQEYLQALDQAEQPAWLQPISTVYYGYRDGERKGRHKEKTAQPSSFLSDLIKSEIGQRATRIIKKP